MRDRLIKLLDDGCKGAKLYDKTRRVNEQIADYLLENNVVVMPCKVGDTVWYISEENPFVAFEKELKARPDPTPIKGILITEEGLYTCTSEIDRVKDFCDKVGEQYAYLSEEDANKAIEQRKEGNGI